MFGRVVSLLLCAQTSQACLVIEHSCFTATICHQEFKCEICGNHSYWGRRAYERHFKEWRHQHGMRCLGIPNTKNFNEITSIEVYHHSRFICLLTCIRKLMPSLNSSGKTLNMGYACVLYLPVHLFCHEVLWHLWFMFDRRRRHSGREYNQSKVWTSGGQTWKKSTRIRMAIFTTRRLTQTCSAKAWYRIVAVILAF
jgi:hypothetical protein